MLAMFTTEWLLLLKYSRVGERMGKRQMQDGQPVHFESITSLTFTSLCSFSHLGGTQCTFLPKNVTLIIKLIWASY